MASVSAGSPSWWWPNSTTAALVTSTAVATASLLVLARATLWPHRAQVLRSPLRTVADTEQKKRLDKELASLVYRPDSFPGARDVDTPYGTVRVYEFGPEEGDKVLFVHGISTSCITLARIARALVERGCRVMLFVRSLVVRVGSAGLTGFPRTSLAAASPTASAISLPYDARLYTSQMLCVLASSPLAWTGRAALRLVGYSLGGAITVHFANAFPELVLSLVLLAPAGLIRLESFGAASRFVFSSGIIPERLLAHVTRRRLRRPIVASRLSRSAGAGAAEATNLNPPRGGSTPLEERVLEYVRWMADHYEGFVSAFTSTLRFAPLTAQHDNWRRLAQRAPGSTAVLLAEADEIIDVDEYTRHGLPLAGGRDRVVWRVLPGSHDFVMTHANAILDELDELWGMKKPS